MTEQYWCRRCEGSINNICVVKILKWGVLKVDDSQGNELGKYGGWCYRVKNEHEWSWGGER